MFMNKSANTEQTYSLGSSNSGSVSDLLTSNNTLMIY